MKYFPVFLDAKNISAMVVGGGEVATRKIELLLKATTHITIMSETVCVSIERLINLHQLTWLAHNYEPPRPVFAQIISVRFEEIPFLFPIPVQVATPYTYKSGPLAGPPCPVSTVHLGHGLGCPSAPRPIPRGHVTPQLLAVRLELRAHCERAAVNRSKA